MNPPEAFLVITYEPSVLMNDHASHEPKLDDVLAFNQTLLKLEKAGVPIRVGDSDTSDSLQTQLDSINSKVTMAIARGSSVLQIAESHEELPIPYRSALSTWLLCDHSPAALAALSEHAGQRREIERMISFSLLQPLIIATLAYLGFVYLIFGLSPKLDSITNQIGTKPGFGLQFLQWAKNTAWIWGFAFPSFLLLAVFLLNRNLSRWKLKLIPGRKEISISIENANKAEGIRSLLETNNSQLVPEPSPHTTRLLTLALSEGLSREAKIGALSASAKTYRGMARTRTVQLHAWLPALVGASLGGLLVLAFGLSLFAPMIELLTALTRP